MKTRMISTMMLRKTISDNLLELLAGGAASIIDIAWAMSTTKLSSYKRLISFRDGRDNSPGRKIIRDWRCARDEYKRYHSLLNSLKKQGLVGMGDDGDWMITKSGTSRLRAKDDLVSMGNRLVVSGRVTILSYDIPERMRRERNRIREILKMIGFEQAHQSLWVGNKKVTKKFLDILRELRIFDYVHIFEVNKTGTLKRIGKATMD